ncbi:MAG: hypothetical protein IKF24_00985 [Eubacterium sp.]|nr:hypothetical protein [Eubacterium sp.]
METEGRIVILDHIKNICKRRCIIPVVAIVILVALLFIVPFFSLLSPKKVDGIFNVKSSDSFIEISTKQMKYTGYDVKNGLGTKFSYYYALKDGKCAFALIPHDLVKAEGKDLPDDAVKEELKDLTFKAKVIKPNSSYKKMIELFANDLNWSEDELNSISTGWIVSSANYHPYRYLFSLILIIALIGFAIFRLVTAIKSYKDPYRFEVCSYLSKEESRELIDEAQDELDSENYLQINATYITENYYIDLDTSGAFIIPLKDVIWVFRLGRRGVDIGKHSLTYTINFITRDGEVVKVPRKSSDEAMAIIKSIKATEYEIITGHSDEKMRMAAAIIRGREEENAETQPEEKTEE